MEDCYFCGKYADENDPENYYEVTSWVTGPKLQSPKLRERTGRVAHTHCVENLVHGQAPDQPELFVTDEPGQVWKVTGKDSMHTAIQSGQPLHDEIFSQSERLD